MASSFATKNNETHFDQYIIHTPIVIFIQLQILICRLLPIILNTKSRHANPFGYGLSFITSTYELRKICIGYKPLNNLSSYYIKIISFTIKNKNNINQEEMSTSNYRTNRGEDTKHVYWENTYWEHPCISGLNNRINRILTCIRQ